MKLLKELLEMANQADQRDGDASKAYWAGSVYDHNIQSASREEFEEGVADARSGKPTYITVSDVQGYRVTFAEGSYIVELPANWSQQQVQQFCDQHLYQGTGADTDDGDFE